MALMPCAYCRLVPVRKLHACIWAWHSEAGRVAWKTRACDRCLPEALAAFGQPLPTDGDYVQLPSDCALCGEPMASADMSVTYLTWYESDGPHSAIYACCDRDGAERHAAVTAVAESLEDRQRQDRRRGA